MFAFDKPGTGLIAEELAMARTLPEAAPELMTLQDGRTRVTFPWGFSHDLSCSMLGYGEETFDRARAALRQWVEFDLGWVQVANREARIEVGETVAVVAHTAGLWSVNCSRIMETIETPTQSGFLYTTTRMHVEEGQERFLLRLDEDTGEVHYLIEAVSRPRHGLARLGWPLARVMQHRFARDSHRRMRTATRESS